MVHSGRGAFITLEGLEGAGKSTSVKTIQDVLAARGLPYICTREPGGTELGEQLRQLLLHSRMFPMTELLLMFAARTEHLQEVIIPAMESGQWVICDRFTDSSYAYQGGGRRIELGNIAKLEQLALGGIVPDCTFILDLPVEAGLSRVGKRGQMSLLADRFENEQLQFYERTREVFLSRANSESRFRIIDASGSVADVQQHIQASLHSFIAGFPG